MALDTQDKQFISDLFDRKFDEKFEQKFNVKFAMMSKHFDERFGHYFGLLKEDFDHKFSILVEIAKDKPGREEVRQIVREEAGYAVDERMKDIFVPEVKEIRVKQKNHEKRITKLEAALT
jgi:hypothetical protein